MKLLLDTHVLLWALNSKSDSSSDSSGDSSGSKSELSAAVRAEIASEENLVFISIVSLWELCIKESLDKIELPADFYKKLQPAGFEILPVSVHHLKALRRLPLHHRDPFDRMLVAQAQAEQLTLVSRDHEIKKYHLSLLQA